jgi:uncharacterized membrane protein
MDFTHLHLLLNHFPIIGTLIALMFLAYGVYSGSRRTTKMALFTIVLMAILAIPVFLTGEPAEEAVENLPGVTEAIIEEHEEAAELAIWIMAFLGALSAVSFASLITTNQMNKALLGATLLLGLITFGAMARTGYLGGQIRHTEIRGGGSAALNVATPAGNSAESEQDDD